MQMQTKAPAYTARAGNPSPGKPEAGTELFRQYQAAKKAFQQFEATFAGALFATIFLERPYLAELKLELIADSASGDEGDVFRTISARVSEVRVIDGAVVPVDFMEDGSPEPTAIESDLEIELQDMAGDLYCCFETDTGCYDDLEFTIERNRIAYLLTQEMIDGREAYIKLFPDFISEVQDVE